MKGNLQGGKLDHLFCIEQMDMFEKVGYDLIYKDTEFQAKDWTIVLDAFIEDCIASDMIVREHLYYPKR